MTSREISILQEDVLERIKHASPENQSFLITISEALLDYQNIKMFLEKYK